MLLGGPSGPGQPSPSVGIVLNSRVPAIPLLDQWGRTTSLAAFRGKYIVLANFLTLCQDECPLVTGAFLSMERAVRTAGLSRQVVFVEATVDPQRDTPARLRAYAREFGTDWLSLLEAGQPGPAVELLRCRLSGHP